MDQLSLIKFCCPCNSKCCKTGKLIGSPIISIEESKKLSEEEKTHLQKIISPSDKKYFIIMEQKNSNRCFFLNQDNTCRIQKNKPLDCFCYPIKAIFLDKGINYIIDLDCPACFHLSKEFITIAKKIALKSIKRFDKETYNHWLDNNVGWVEEKTLLDDFLKKITPKPKR